MAKPGLMLLIFLAATGVFASAANADAQRHQFVRSPKLVTGLVAPVLTAFYPNGTLNVATVPAQAAALAAQGVKWAFVCGSTGQSVDLDVQERKSLAQAW